MKHHRPWAKSGQSGQSSVDYVITCAVIALILGLGMRDDSSVLFVLLEAFRTTYQKISYALSLPAFLF
jgi:hypothetical protein